MFRSSCLVCNSSELKTIIDLGMHPFADTFIPLEKAGEADAIYPLICDLCEKCGQIQTKCITNPEDRYVSTDYSYTSANSAFSRNHWDEFAYDVMKETNLTESAFVIEIGSNDGYLAEHFVKKGCKVLGVDPSPYMAKLAEQRKVKTLVNLFDKKSAEKIKKEYGKADLIIANNVFNHSDQPLEFAQAVADILSKNGKFVFELPYWSVGLKSKKFDQIYHEHVSYFTVKSAKSLLEKAGMKITILKVVDYHGGSLRVIAQKAEDLKDESSDISKMIAEEEKEGAFNLETYSSFMNDLHQRKSLFLEKIHGLKKVGAKIIAVGAAAKGNTFLNFYNLNKHTIDYVTDSSDHKKGKFTPATRIPICGDEIFKNQDNVFALILSWNIANQLKDKLHQINPNIQFLVPD